MTLDLSKAPGKNQVNRVENRRENEISIHRGCTTGTKVTFSFAIPLREPKGKGRCHHPQDGQFIEELTQEAQGGMEVGGAATHDDEHEPDDVDPGVEEGAVAGRKDRMFTPLPFRHF